MKKIKMKLSYSDASIVQAMLEEIIDRGYTLEDTNSIIRFGLCTEMLIRFMQKTMFKYEGEKSISISIPQAALLHQCMGGYIKSCDELQRTGSYNYIFFLELRASIDQKLKSL